MFDGLLSGDTLNALRRMVPPPSISLPRILFPDRVRAHLKCKIGIRIGFIQQGEMPPLCIQRLKAVTVHSVPQQRVCVLARPVILAADGYPLIDDCGGIDGYVETLSSIEDGDKDSKAWAEGMGWKKKIDKGVL